jgi:ribosomal protein L37AE/L43A
MSFEDIPEDREESYACSKCHFGSVTQNIITGAWECDKCDFVAEQENINE